MSGTGTLSVVAPKAGSKHVLQGERVGEGVGAIPAGTEVTVREVVKAGAGGAGDGKTDAVVVEFDEAVLVEDDDGPSVGSVTRAVSFGVDEFSDKFKAKRS